MTMGYESTIHELERRIDALVSDHPEVLLCQSPWELFKIPGFTCGDLAPSLGQASVALANVRVTWKRRGLLKPGG